MPYRRAHSLAGAIFGGFAALHLLVAAAALKPAAFDQNGQALHILAVNFRVLEILAVWLPLLVISLCGVVLLRHAGLAYNLKRCNRGGKLRFFLQRTSAVVIMAFLTLHLVTFRFAGVYDPGHPFATVSAGIRGLWRAGGSGHPLNLLVSALYLAGILAFVYHLANGLWTGAIAWELCSSPAARRRLGGACAVAGIGLALLGVLAWFALVVSPFLG